MKIDEDLVAVEKEIAKGSQWKDWMRNGKKDDGIILSFNFERDCGK